MIALQKNVLWVDCIGAGIAGLAMLMLAAVLVAPHASVFGIAHLAGEGFYVG